VAAQLDNWRSLLNMFHVAYIDNTLMIVNERFRGGLGAVVLGGLNNWQGAFPARPIEQGRTN
jgi:hypothetical protein